MPTNFVPYPKVPCHSLLPGGEFQLLPLATEDLEDDDKPLLLDDEDLYEDLDQPPPDLDEDVLVLTLNLKRVSISPAIKRMINIIWQNNITTLCFISFVSTATSNDLFIRSFLPLAEARGE